MPSSFPAVSSHGSLHTGSSRNMTFSKFQMEIRLKNHFRSKVYNTGAPIDGEVVITTQRDVRFDTIQIILLGVARTRVEGVGAPHATTHTLLKLAMPIPESIYPVPRILEAGRTYRIPFNFVVPSHLTIGACNHRVPDYVRDHHLTLPPTMGSWERDDMAPQTAKVEYCIKARVLREPAAEAAAAAHGIKIMEAAEEITILPTFPELPPINVGKMDVLYRMSKTKTLRKNLMSSKVGRVTATATQPSAVFLRADSLSASETTAHVRLDFEPAAADVLPPKVTGVSGKLMAYTFYSSSAMKSLPDLVDANAPVQTVLERRAAYGTSVPLFSTQLEVSRWQQQLRNPARRDSGYSSCDLDGDQERQAKSRAAGARRGAESSPIFHTCDLQVPVRLPDAASGKCKTFIPSFYSCIVSRVYVLQLTVNLAGPGSTSLVLMLPLQVAAEPGAEAGMGHEELPDFETALEEAEADQHLRPRTILVPDPRFMQTSVLPAYA